MTRGLMLVLGLGALPGQLAAQATGDRIVVKAGSPIRIYAPRIGPDEFTATSWRVEAQTLRIRWDSTGAEPIIPFADIESLNVPSGIQRDYSRWMERGIAVGTLAGAFGGLTYDTFFTGTFKGQGRTGRVLRGAGIGLVAGWGLGAIVGHFTHGTRWIIVEPSNLQVAVQPLEGGAAGLGLSLTLPRP